MVAGLGGCQVSADLQMNSLLFSDGVRETLSKTLFGTYTLIYPLADPLLCDV